MYAVLIDTGCDWPDVVYAGHSHWVAHEIAGRVDPQYPTRVQAVVTVAEAIKHGEEEAD